MSLRFALLGLLDDAPGSGYELTRRFEHTLQRYAWHAKHSQIYPELTRLADDGLVVVVDEGARGRRTYAITEPGREELREWLRNPPTQKNVRNEEVLRMFLLSTLPAAEARVLLEQTAIEAERDLAELTEVVRAQDARCGEEGLWFGRLAAEFGLRQHTATLDWARWALANLSA